MANTVIIVASEKAKNWLSKLFPASSDIAVITPFSPTDAIVDDEATTVVITPPDIYMGNDSVEAYDAAIAARLADVEDAQQVWIGSDWSEGAENDIRKILAEGGEE